MKSQRSPELWWRMMKLDMMYHILSHVSLVCQGNKKIKVKGIIQKWCYGIFTIILLSNIVLYYPIIINIIIKYYHPIIIKYYHPIIYPIIKYYHPIILFYQIFSYIIKYCSIFPYVILYYRIFPYITQYYQILSYIRIIVYYQILYYQILSNIIEYYQILSYI